jgi:hypothetical protein
MDDSLPAEDRAALKASVIEQSEAGGQSLQEISQEHEQLAVIRRAVQAVDVARRRSAGS